MFVMISKVIVRFSNRVMHLLNCLSNEHLLSVCNKLQGAYTVFRKLIVPITRIIEQFKNMFPQIFLKRHQQVIDNSYISSSLLVNCG